MRARRWAVAGVALLSVIGMAGLAGAHTNPAHFTPKPDSVVTVAPDRLDLTFSEDLKQLQVAVLDVNGQPVTTGAPIMDPSDHKHAMVPLKAGLPVGSYTVRWEAVSEDGDGTADRYHFYVTAPGDSGSVRVFRNGQEIKGDVPAQIINGRTMVPVRALAEATGEWVEWDPAQRFVTLSEPPAEHHTLEAYRHPAGAPAPTVQVTVTPDARSGFNLHVETTNWTWAPEKINTDPKPNEGHANLYVDGVKVVRLYGPWYQLDHLAPGPHDLRVTLNANNYAEYVVDGDEALAATASIISR